MVSDSGISCGEIEILKILLTLQQNGVDFHLENGEFKWDALPGVLSPKSEKTLSSHNRVAASIVSRLESGIDSSEPVEHIPRTGTIPLSFGQERLWFLDQWGLMGSAYNIPPAIYSATGFIDGQFLLKSIQEVVRRHEILRTRFVSIDGTPFQQIDNADAFNVALYDLTEISALDQEAEIHRLLRIESELKYDLSTGPLFRASVYCLGLDEHLLVFLAHHIVLDGWSQDILIREVLLLYDSFSNGRSSPLEELTVQYADYAIWQRARNLMPQLAYWVGTLAGYEDGLPLPYDHSRPRRRNWRAETIVHRFPTQLARQATKFAAANRLTPFMLFLSALSIVVSRHAGRSDLCLGTSVAGRDNERLENLMGFFVNILPLRIDLSGDPSGDEILSRVRSVLVDALEHQALPFEHILRAFADERSQSHVPLVPVMARHQNWSSTRSQCPDLAGIHVTKHKLGAADLEFPQMAKCELDFVLYGDGEDLQLGLEYAADLIDRSTAIRWAESCECVLRQLISSPSLPLSRIALSEVARRQKGRGDEYSDPRVLEGILSVSDLFEKQVAMTPERTACIDDDNEMSFSALNNQVVKITSTLLDHGITRGSLVGLYTSRSPQYLACLLGVLRAGAAFVPLDPSHPLEYVLQIVRDAQPRLILTTSRLRELLPIELRTIELESIAVEPVNLPQVQTPPDQLAYVAYTSGSTGKAKGVMVQHRQILNWLYAMWDRSPFQIEEVVAQKSPISFVVSVKEMLGGLLRGIPIAFISDSELKDAREFLACLERRHVTRLNVVPSHLEVLIDAIAHGCVAPQSLKYCITAGEPLTARLLDRARRAMPWVEFWNNYGCTELNDVTYFRCSDSSTHGKFIPIGKAIRGIRARILDAELRPVPDGVVGELYVEGKSMPIGYLGQPALTATRFVADLHSNEPGARIYRTGDLVRAEKDGNLSYIGRTDFEVKVRGHRIDVRHVEQTLLDHSAIVRVVVHNVPNMEGNLQLSAYYISDGSDCPTPSELRNYLSERIPDYMIPAVDFHAKLTRGFHRKLTHPRFA